VRDAEPFWAPRFLRCPFVAPVTILSYSDSSKSIQFSLLVTPTGAVLRHVIRHTSSANLRTLPVHATASLARGGTRRSRVSRKPQRQEACDSYGCGCGCHIRDLLVSNTGTVPPHSLQLCGFFYFFPHTT